MFCGSSRLMPMPPLPRGLSMLPTFALLVAIPAGAAEVNGTLLIAPSRLAGADDLGRVLL